LVYPEPKKPSDEFVTSLNSNNSGNITESSIFNFESADIDGLKEYVIGESIKNINWKSIFKSEKIMVKNTYLLLESL